jgi:hypothetical protein
MTKPQNSHDVTQAEAILEVAKAIDGLLYGLKYSKDNGMSIAEAIEVSGTKISEAIDGLATAIREHGDVGLIKFKDTP